MTVQELREVAANLPDDAEVRVLDEDSGVYVEATATSSVTPDGRYLLVEIDV